MGIDGRCKRSQKEEIERERKKKACKQKKDGKNVEKMMNKEWAELLSIAGPRYYRPFSSERTVGAGIRTPISRPNANIKPTEFSLFVHP